MLLKASSLAQILVIRPGATDFDDQGRIKGSLDMPLSELGREQARALATELADVDLNAIYTSPCESARETAELLAGDRGIRIKSLEALRNIDHGLWHGKLIDDVRRNHPKVYRQGLDCPEEISLPGGESIREAKARVAKVLKKIVRKNRDEVAAIVTPDPLAAVVASLLSGEGFQDLWKAETDFAQWQLVTTAMS